MPAATDAGMAQVSGLDEVVARMKDLASNRGDSLRRSKRDRSTLKGTFRDLVGMVEVRTSLLLINALIVI